MSLPQFTKTAYYRSEQSQRVTSYVLSHHAPRWQQQHIPVLLQAFCHHSRHRQYGVHARIVLTGKEVRHVIIYKARQFRHSLHIHLSSHIPCPRLTFHRLNKCCHRTGNTVSTAFIKEHNYKTVGPRHIPIYLEHLTLMGARRQEVCYVLLI